MNKAKKVTVQKAKTGRARKGAAARKPQVAALKALPKAMVRKTPAAARKAVQKAKARKVTADPTTVATVWHSMQTICREMRHVIDRTAQNFLIIYIY